VDFLNIKLRFLVGSATDPTAALQASARTSPIRGKIKKALKRKINQYFS
jgi:hypothetical protein